MGWEVKEDRREEGGKNNVFQKREYFELSENVNTTIDSLQCAALSLSLSLSLSHTHTHTFGITWQRGVCVFLHHVAIFTFLHCLHELR